MNDESDDERITPPRTFDAQERPTAAEIRTHRQTHPAGAPAVMMSDTDRALQSRRHRKPPLEYIDDSSTSPGAVFDFEERDHAAQVAELAMRLRRMGLDPLVAAAALSISAARKEKREREARNEIDTGQRELERQLREFLAVQPGGAKFAELERAVDDLARDLEEVRKPAAFDEMARSVTELKTGMQELAPVRKGLRWLQASVVLVVIGIGTWLYARGGKETSIDMKIEALEKLTDKLVDRIEQITEYGRREWRESKDAHP